MLWERTDPQRALQKRFGFDSFDEAVQWLTKVLAETWAIELETCERLVISDGNVIAWVDTDRGALVVKWSRAQEQFAKFTALAELIHSLHRHGVPVALPLASSDGSRRVIIGAEPRPLSMTVQLRVEGEPLDATDTAAVRAAGACLATLHRAMAIQVEAPVVESAQKRPLDLHQRIADWLDRGDPGSAPAASGRLRDRLSSMRPIDAEPQLIHNDYRAGNILTANSRVTGVLDFDEIAWDYCVADLAQASVYLATRFTDWQPTPGSVREILFEGYESVRPLTHLEHDWLPTLVLWSAINAIPPGPDPAGWAHAL
jgi:homoserine kinase type II